MDSPLNKLIHPDGAGDWLRQVDHAGPVAVVTGTYDIFHPGNLLVLSNARSVASTVLVVLETDEQARGHLPEGRPRHGLETRVEMVAGLRDVDGVTWGRIPDGAPVIWVVGRLQRAGDVFRDSLEAAARQVHEVPHVEGCSTADIIRSIRDHRTPIRVPALAYGKRGGTAVERGSGCVVTVNGCFDILHIGHLRFLAQARALGDSLTVLINSDASVARYKGATRPVFPESFRKAALKALSVVDEVIVFDEDDPLDVMGRIRPDIHVKGGSFEPGRVNQERELVESWGGRLVGMPLVEGFSTTAIIRRLIGG